MQHPWFPGQSLSDRHMGFGVQGPHIFSYIISEFVLLCSQHCGSPFALVPHSLLSVHLISAMWTHFVHLDSCDAMEQHSSHRHSQAAQLLPCLQLSAWQILPWLPVPCHLVFPGPVYSMWGAISTMSFSSPLSSVTLLCGGDLSALSHWES